MMYLYKEWKNGPVRLWNGGRLRRRFYIKNVELQRKKQITQFIGNESFFFNQTIKQTTEHRLIHINQQNTS